MIDPKKRGRQVLTRLEHMGRSSGECSPEGS